MKVIIPKVFVRISPTYFVKLSTLISNMQQISGNNHQDNNNFKQSHQ